VTEPNDDKTPADGIVLEYTLGDDDKTPVPSIPDPCPGCQLKTLVRKGDDLRAPGSPAEAMKRFTECTAPRSGKFFVCGAGPFLVVPSAGVKVYLGPERRRAMVTT